MDGLSVKLDEGFPELIAPIKDSIAGYYWLVDSFIGCAISGIIANPRSYDDILVDSRSLSESQLSGPLITPYSIDVFSQFFTCGEGSLFIGIPADDDDEAICKAKEIDKPRRYGVPFFQILSKHAMLMVLFTHDYLGNCEVYCSDEGLLSPLEKRFKARPIDSFEEGIGRRM